VARQLAGELWYDDAQARVEPEEVADFMDEIAPMLERMPQYETYEQFHVAEIGHIEDSAGFGDMFGFMDILFLAFGVVSAIRLANGEQG